MKSEIDLGTLTRRLGLQSANLQGTEETKMLELGRYHEFVTSLRRLEASLKQLESLLGTISNTKQVELLNEFINDKKQSIDSTLGRAKGSVALSYVVAKLLFDPMWSQVDVKIRELSGEI